MKPTGRRTTLAILWLAGCCAAAEANRPDRSVPLELELLVGVVTQWTQRGIKDEEAFFHALIEIIPPLREQEKLSVLARFGNGMFERRFHFGPRSSAPGTKAEARPFAVTTAGRRRPVSFCADTTPLVCVRRDGFEPRVKAGRCDDPRCEVFARGEQMQQASALFSGR